MNWDVGSPVGHLNFSLCLGSGSELIYLLMQFISCFSTTETALKVVSIFFKVIILIFSDVSP